MNSTNHDVLTTDPRKKGSTFRKVPGYTTSPPMSPLSMNHSDGTTEYGAKELRAEE